MFTETPIPDNTPGSQAARFAEIVLTTEPNSPERDEATQSTGGLMGARALIIPDEDQCLDLVLFPDGSSLVSIRGNEVVYVCNTPTALVAQIAEIAPKVHRKILERAETNEHAAAARGHDDAP